MIREIYERMEVFLKKYPFLPYGILIISYIILRLPDALVVKKINAIQVPLEFVYAVKELLFSGHAVNPALAHVAVTPSCIFFIYPPGLPLLTVMLGDLGHVFLFFFLFQLIVPVLFFRLLCKASSRSVALLVAFMSSCYFTTSDWWAPDWIIQPLSILGVLILMGLKNKKGAREQGLLLILGLLSGAIIVLKHNIGITFCILAVTGLFLNALEAHARERATAGRGLMLLFLLGYAIFFGLFLSKLSHSGEMIYYLFAYSVFWTLFSCYVYQNKAVSVLWGKFLRQAGVFFLAMALLPLGLFFLFGTTIGYARYGHSFFMGLDHAAVWERSLTEVASLYCRFHGIKGVYLSCIYIFFFLLPLAVNVLVVSRLWALVKDKRMSFDAIKRYFLVGSFGIMGVFLFFPLEGLHILVTKLFIFCFVLFYFLKDLSGKAKALVMSFFIPCVVLEGVFLAHAPVKIFKTQDYSEGSSQVKRVVGMRMKEDVALELQKQIDTLERSIKGEAYYVVGQDSSALGNLMALVSNPRPQFYMEMRSGILGQEATHAIINEIRNRDFVVVNAQEDQAYFQNRGGNEPFRQILEHVHKNFSEIDHYQVSSEVLGQGGFTSFLVMRRNR